ncbi:MAG: hypothetical protein K2G32_10390 [Oscillospiraceae bacterium]|nr:hypothetical protein [Oscillospiraceae bacterium]
MKHILKSIPWAALGSMLLFAALIVWFIAALSGAGAASDEQTLTEIKQSVENGITMCYSIEGVYPESIDYLRESYGVVYDTERYIVHYESLAANIRPAVTVIERKA